MLATQRGLRLLACAISISAVLLVAKDRDKDKKQKPPAASAASAMPADKQIVHALNRLTFGARPGDVERVKAIGLDKWFDEQLHPDKLDDSALEARISPFRTLKMSTREMIENFPPPQVLKAVENGRISMPHDPAKRAVYESRMAAMDERKQRKQDGANNPNQDAQAEPSASMKAEDNDAADQRRAQQEVSARGFGDLLQLAPDDRYKKILKMSPDDRLDMARAFRGPRAMQLVDGMKPEQQETVEAIINPQIVVGGELSEAKLLRAIYSERQLDEVMTDFWFNHFNVFIGKGPDRYMVTAYERDVIRPHALGKFKDLLVATAKSPAMLFYLDNWQSVGPNSDLATYGPAGPPRVRRGRYARFPRPQNPNAKKNRPSGLNENYAREIMELHTLGVDGGYTQKDVTELAKVLTGWSIEQPQRGGGFRFNERAHEPGTKYVLGHKIKEHGEGEGMEMLEVLSRHPSTAKFISRKLAMRFVSDNPPQSLVDRMAKTFLDKDGDIREVLRTMFQSPEFWSADAYRAKVKTPFEFVVSAARASAVDVQNALPLVQTLNRMGMPLYGMQPPTGYSMKADAWVNSSALLNRMNFALALGSGRLPGTSLDQQVLLHGGNPPDEPAVLAALENEILAGDVSAQTHSVLVKQLSDPQVAQRRLDDPGRMPNVGAIAGLIMGSPEFQRR
jgi:uncharacterized protein (DUF1800 family)